MGQDRGIKKAAILSTDNEKDAPFRQIFEGPLGLMCVGASEKGLRYIKVIRKNQPSIHKNNITESCVEQLSEYFENRLTRFDVPVDLEGYSDFSIRVWNQLLKIQYGKTITYMQLAIQLSDPKCIRAAASANGRNPIPIIIPCHRVIGSDGSMTGFALGLDFKRGLLGLENPQKFSANQTIIDFGNL